MIDVTGLVRVVFSGLSALVIEDVEDAGEVIVVRARTRDGAVACPGCGAETSRVHGYHERTAADVPVDGRRVVVKVRARRMRCPALGCKTQTFREQVSGVLERYQRRISRLTAQVSAVARELAGRASARLLPALGIGVSRHTALRVLLRITLPALEVPRVLGIDDFALRRGLVYATILIDAETGRRVDVLEGRTADVVEDWLRGHPGAEVVTRDGSGAYGEAVRSALPGAVQCGDRWHLWHLLAEASAKEVAAHWCTISLSESLTCLLGERVRVHPWSPPGHRHRRSTLKVQNEFREARRPRTPRLATGLCANERRSVSDRLRCPGTTGCLPADATARGQL
jgi:transposase